MKWLLYASLLGALLINSAFAAAANSEIYYDQLFQDNRLDVTIFLGYEQQKSDLDTPVVKDLVNAVKDLSRDQENTLKDVAGIEQAILGCVACNLQKQSEGQGSRVYTTVFGYKGRSIVATVKFFFSEAGVKASDLRDKFIAAIGNDDVVVYLGHARDGHGFPDFASPLADTGKIFYNDPVQGWMGFNKGYFSRTKYQVLMLNACQTDRYYRQVIRSRVWEKEASKLGLILSSDNTWFEDYPDTTAALLHGLITQQTRGELLDTLSQSANYYNSLHFLDANKQKLFVGDGFFDSTYAPKPKPKRIEPKEPWRDMPF